VTKQSLHARDPPVRPPCSTFTRHCVYCRRNNLDANQLRWRLFRTASRRREDRSTEDPILAVSFSTTTLLKLLTEDQWRVTCDILPVLRLPFPLHPNDPNISCIDRSRDDAKTTKETVDPEVDATAFSKIHGNRGDEETQDETEYLKSGAGAHD